MSEGDARDEGPEVGLGQDESFGWPKHTVRDVASCGGVLRQTYHPRGGGV